MARKERERYTERKRPHRKDTARASSTGNTANGSPWSNPVVIVAALGLVLAVVLAAGFLIGRDASDTRSTADDPATTAITDTAQSALTPGVEVAEPVTATQPTPIPAGALWLPGEGSPYAQPDDLGLDGATTAYFAIIETVSGTIRAELWPEIAPAHVNSFVFLAREGFFDGLTFHRVEDWVVQGGDPTGSGMGGPGYLVPAEFNADNLVNHRYGALAMARSQDINSAGSQFYFIKDPAGAAMLDGQYTVFGHVIDGMDVVAALTQGAVMTSVTIEERPKAESVVDPDAIRAGDLPEPPPAEAND